MLILYIKTDEANLGPHLTFGNSVLKMRDDLARSAGYIQPFDRTSCHSRKQHVHEHRDCGLVMRQHTFNRDRRRVCNGAGTHTTTSDIKPKIGEGFGSEKK